MRCLLQFKRVYPLATATGPGVPKDREQNMGLRLCRQLEIMPEALRPDRSSLQSLRWSSSRVCGVQRVEETVMCCCLAHDLPSSRKPRNLKYENIIFVNMGAVQSLPSENE